MHAYERVTDIELTSVAGLGGPTRGYSTGLTAFYVASVLVWLSTAVDPVRLASSGLQDLYLPDRPNA